MRYEWAYAFQLNQRTSLGKKVAGVFRPKERAAGRFFESALPNTLMTFGFSREEFGDLCVRQPCFQNARLFFFGRRGNLIPRESRMSALRNFRINSSACRFPCFVLEATQSAGMRSS